MSRSHRVQSGCPNVYQVQPKVEFKKSLKRMTVGEKNPKYPHKTILLVGETGAGKSTLINTLFNYTIGVTQEDKVWFQIVQGESGKQSESQTTDVIVYEVFGFEGKPLPYSLTIIDTPGFGDTGGVEKDDKIPTRLYDLFRSSDGIKDVTTVALVLKASTNRLTDRMQYVFDSVMSLFDKRMEKQIVTLFTHSNGKSPKNALAALEDAKMKCAKTAKNQPVHFMFDNCQHEKRTEDEDKIDFSYLISLKGLEALTTFLETCESCNIKDTVNVLTERIRLNACIQNLKERIKEIPLKKTEIEQTQQAVMEFEQGRKACVYVDETYKVVESAGNLNGKWGLGLFLDGATRCTVCKENCHYPGCTHTLSPRYCEIMTNGRCTSCTNRCEVSAHVKDTSIYVTKTRKVTMTIEDVQKKYGMYKEEYAKYNQSKSILDNLESEMKGLTLKMAQLLDMAYQHVIKLDQIALKINSASLHVHVDFLIEKLEKSGDTQKVQKLMEIKKRENAGISATVTSGFAHGFAKACKVTK